jgi:Na+:H+ antiporter, NhaA family
MSDRVLTALIAVACIGAASSTVLLATRTFQGSAPAPTSSASAAPTVIPDWRRYAEHAARVSPDSGASTIVEFSDLQCPFCRHFTFELDTIEARYPGRFTVLFHHFPLDDIHPSARAAAIAAVCAERQGAFARFVHEIALHQDQLGLKPMRWFAARAGVANAKAFTRCQSDSSSARVIAADIALGTALHVEGTPTILIDSVRFVGAPSLATVDSLVQRSTHFAAR